MALTCTLPVSYTHLDVYKRQAESFSEVLQEMRFNQIVCYEKLGDWENAKTKIAEYIQVYPDDADAQREAKFLETR